MELRAAADALLSRLTGALGLAPIAQRGELLRLLPEELAEFDVRGLRPELVRGARALLRRAAGVVAWPAGSRSPASRAGGPFSCGEVTCGRPGWCGWRVCWS